jgi:hypothetical protein
MGILTKAVNEQAYLKCGIYADAGAGKTTTASYLAMAISNCLGNKKPVAFFETESGSDFLVGRFQQEGIELLRVKSHSLTDLIETIDEAEKVASVLIVDSLTHVWGNLIESKLNAVNKSRKSKNCDPIERLEFQHYADIKTQWARWTTKFLNANLHIIVCGRAGDIWERVENDKGKMELQSVGTRMKAEKEFGYEPSLSIEMERVLNPNGGWSHKATVLKDRSDSINGKQFTFTKPTAAYKKGDWKAVYKSFEPAIRALNIGSEHKTIDETRNAEGLFPTVDGESRSIEFARRREIALEEIKHSLMTISPGTGEAAKTTKGIILNELFGTRSWTAVEGKDIAVLEFMVPVMRDLEKVLATPLETVDEMKAAIKAHLDSKADKDDPLPESFNQPQQ